MASSIEYKSLSADETMSFARGLALRGYGRGKVFLLEGNIGSGKTTFIRGFVSAWELDSIVTSPTFTILNEYKSDKVRICHYDFYRINSMEDILELGLEDYITNCDYSFIEWPDIGMPMYNFEMIKVLMKQGINENERIITINPVKNIL
jgi:tRNA threonylcarbamoyladenosine biosynthesis protein TsaE